MSYLHTTAFRSLAGLDAQALAAQLGREPLVLVDVPNGAPRGATCLLLVAAPTEVVWQLVANAENFPRFVNMVEQVSRVPGARAGEDRVQVDLRFKISVFSARFHFIADARREEGRLIELRSREGKVRDVLIQLELAPIGASACLLRVQLGFDQTSLGWLVKVFIRHAPEIDWGVHAGSALSVATAIRSECEASAARDRPAMVSG